MKDFIVTDIKSENTILVGLITPEESEEKVTEYLDELEFLAQTAKINPVHRVTQRLPIANSVTFVGTGKLNEIKEYIDS
ncbi:MAG: GTPase HflX, partial [Dysgonamonadaceae bacterium]|nr:GTPase HflX [Dysgonamonadaceae bacterium]